MGKIQYLNEIRDSIKRACIEIRTRNPISKSAVSRNESAEGKQP
jgi:hypothetical protein